jgi:hypothetical protein
LKFLKNKFRKYLKFRKKKYPSELGQDHGFEIFEHRLDDRVEGREGGQRGAEDGSREASLLEASSDLRGF